MMTTFLLWLLYAALGLLWMAVRGMVCQCTYEHFDFSVELLGALVWPASALWWIFQSTVRTNRYPRPWR